MIRYAIGIDVGGTSVKGGLVDLGTGRLDGPSVRRATPSPAVVEPVLDLVVALIRELAARRPAAPGTADESLPVGVGLSSDVLDGRHTSGVSLDPSWLGAPARDLLETRLGRPVTILNDADAAALAEARYGAAGGPGVTLVLTFGTGIGSGILADGRLVPNSGLGQLPLDGGPAELTLSAVARERHGTSWEAWSAAVSGYLRSLDELLRPRRIVVGGGIVAAWPTFAVLLDVPVEVVPAALGPEAGVVGAALAGAEAVSAAGAGAAG